MAGATVTMTAKRQKTLQEIHAEIHGIVDAELVSKREQTINDVIIWTLAYEKFFFRNKSYTSAVVVLTEHAEEQTACVIASGGGSGMVNHSLGANRRFAKECVEKLETCGFTVIQSNLDAKGKGIVERFLR